MDHIRHKCGYCGWLFSFSTNFIDHDCFKHYIEEVDHISVDENYVVTLIKKNSTVVDEKGKLDKLLIEAVRSKHGLYDFRLPASERTMLRKNALWMEVSNMLQDRSYHLPEAAKARWKYLRDNYIKARKKVEAYVPSGSAATAAKSITDKKSRFQYYELMKFLNDSLQTQPTVSSLADASAKSEVTSLDIRNEKQKNDAVPGPSTILQSSAINNSPQTPASLYVPPRTPTPTKDVLSTSTESKVSTRTRTTGSKQSVHNFNDDYEPPVVKKKKTDVAFQTALIEALKEPATQPINPLDGFLVRLGEGMRKLPYRDRARLEIRFLTLLAEMEDR